MCGALKNVIEMPVLPPILTELGYSEEEIKDILNLPGRKKKEARPTDPVLSLIPTRTGPKLMNATWWLKLHNDTLEPDTQWSTFNCRSTQLLSSPLHKIPPKSYRSIVIAEGFYEWQPIYQGGVLYSGLSEEEKKKPPKPVSKQKYLIHKPGQLMFLAAMCKHWVDDDGNAKASTGVITLPPHPAFSDIHHKSFPLVIKDEELSDWLDRTMPTEHFEPLFNLTDVREPFEAIVADEPELLGTDQHPYLLTPGKIKT